MSSIKKRKALGKGLGALLPTNESAEVLTEGRVYLVCPIEKIRPNRFQPRKFFEDSQLSELVNSIKEKGIIQPLIVRSDGDNEYELIAGERRWRAAQKAGLREVPVVVKDASDVESLELAIIENIQRAELNPIEEAEGYRRLIDEFSYTQEDIASRVGKDRATISNHLRVLKLPGDVKKDLSNGRISLGHAKALLSLEKEQEIIECKKKIISKGLSVREAEALAKRFKTDSAKKIKEKDEKSDPNIAILEDKLATFFGTKVQIRRSGRKGKLEIDFYSDEELEGLLERIGL